ncbi:oxidoreductase [Stipitochalara longipes BDJ]|nr:oxidoreductase [Stipitochalara longipes BDJ]
MSHFEKKTFDVDADIPDLSGKVILVTGGNSGIGRPTCLFFAKHSPAKIIVVARNPTTAGTILKEIEETAPKVEVTFLECNLGSLASVQRAAKQIISSNQRLDILLCNAGILNAPLSLSEDGYEIHFAVNYVGHTLLIKLLLPLLLKTTEIQPDVRVILLASSGYRFHDPRGIIFKDLKTTQQNLTLLGLFGGMLRYFQSKLAIILYTVELAHRYPMIKVVAVHPGIVDTPLTPHWVKANILMRFITAGGEGGLKKPEEGSWNQLWAATGSGVVSGEYYEPIGKLGTRTKKSKDKKLCDELWEWTEEQLNSWTV